MGPKRHKPRGSILRTKHPLNLAKNAPGDTLVPRSTGVSPKSNRIWKDQSSFLHSRRSLTLLTIYSTWGYSKLINGRTLTDRSVLQLKFNFWSLIQSVPVRFFLKKLFSKKGKNFFIIALRHIPSSLTSLLLESNYQAMVSVCFNVAREIDIVFSIPSS